MSQIIGLGADVDAACRVGGDQHGRLGEHLPSDDQLLLVAARQRERTHVDARRAHVEAAYDLVGALAAGVPIDQPVVGELATGLMAEQHVLPQRHGEDHPVAVAVLGDQADPGGAPVERRERADVGSVEEDRAGGRDHPDDGVDQLGLAVALDAGDADDLAGVDVDRHAVERSVTGRRRRVRR